MIEVLNIHPAVLAYRIDGAIDRLDIERALEEVDAKLAREGSLRVFVEMRSVTGISIEALLRDLWLGVQRLNLLPRIDKAVLVTDLEWLRRAAGVQDMFLPGISVKAFPLSELAEAWAWVQS